MVFCFRSFASRVSGCMRLRSSSCLISVYLRLKALRIPRCHIQNRTQPSKTLVRIVFCHLENIFVPSSERRIRMRSERFCSFHSCARSLVLVLVSTSLLTSSSFIRISRLSVAISSARFATMPASVQKYRCRSFRKRTGDLYRCKKPQIADVSVNSVSMSTRYLTRLHRSSSALHFSKNSMASSTALRSLSAVPRSLRDSALARISSCPFIWQ
mmetsp:Transcript_42933/g.115612  ORF Transcript_42933/g.115612 Transcript_42933/m.115612 type:complete len:213 (-) Transcript_42933:1181-1819(-)